MYIKRRLEKDFKHYLSFKEIIAIIGPRQSGKTTLIEKCLNEIKSKKINKISFEDLTILRKFEEDIDAFIIEFVKDYDILFIDEVQYSKNSGQKLKYIYDKFSDKIKIIISCSSATELSINSIKYLVGRILVFNLNTLSFVEFLEYKNPKLFEIFLKGNLSQIYLEQINKYLENHIKFGGYPRVVLVEKEDDKKEILKNIYNTYLLKEIKEILQFKNSYELEILIKNLAIQIGGIINYNDLSAKTGIEYRNLKQQLDLLEKTFICYYVRNFQTNKQIELSKSPKIYFFDLGLRNSILDNFSINLEGNILENFIFSESIRFNKKLKFWRTRTKAEVDFILEEEGEILPIEIKTKLNKNVVGKSMISFIQRYKIKEALFLSLNYKNERIINSTKIRFISFLEFIKENLIKK